MVLELPALPDFEPKTLDFAPIPAFAYSKTLKQEIKEKTLTPEDAV